MTKEELNKLPLEPTLDFIVKELKTIQYLSKEDIVEFNRDIFKDDKVLMTLHELRVQDQVVFRSVKNFSLIDIYSKININKDESEKESVNEADSYFLRQLITYLLLHKLPAIAKLVRLPQV